MIVRAKETRTACRFLNLNSVAPNLPRRQAGDILTVLEVCLSEEKWLQHEGENEGVLSARERTGDTDEGVEDESLAEDRRKNQPTLHSRL